jgi:hypothetical protein
MGGLDFLVVLQLFPIFFCPEFSGKAITHTCGYHHLVTYGYHCLVLKNPQVILKILSEVKHLISCFGGFRLTFEVTVPIATLVPERPESKFSTLTLTAVGGSTHTIFKA